MVAFCVFVTQVCEELQQLIMITSEVQKSVQKQMKNNTAKNNNKLLSLGILNAWLSLGYLIPFNTHLFS